VQTARQACYCELSRPHAARIVRKARQTTHVARAVSTEQVRSSSISSSNQAAAQTPASSQLTIYFREEDITVTAAPGEDLVEVSRGQYALGYLVVACLG
jgi:hypothetical protein